MYEKLVKRLRDAAKMSEALAVLLPYSEESATAKLYNEAADVIEHLTLAVMQLGNELDIYKELPLVDQREMLKEEI